MISIEVTPSEVNIMSYNVKEDITSKLIEKIAEDVTFHEIRETAILGLSCRNFMKAVSNC